MLGKTFKGMTDAMLTWQTARFQELAVGGTDRYVVTVRPELVVEVAFDGVQTSSRYPGGMALRFARVLRYRHDKGPTKLTPSTPSAPSTSATIASPDTSEGTPKRTCLETEYGPKRRHRDRVRLSRPVIEVGDFHRNTSVRTRVDANGLTGTQRAVGGTVQTRVQ